jgi:hypothetical protein
VRAKVTTRVLAVLRTGRIALALALAAGGLTLGACGEDDEGTIPRDDAEALLQEVDTLEQNVEGGDCSLATGTTDRLREQVRLLPKEVGAETKEDLFDLVTNLQNLVDEQCAEASELDTPTPNTGATGAQGSEGGGGSEESGD